MRRRLAAVAVALGLVALAACGGGRRLVVVAVGRPGAELAKLSLGFSAWPGWFPWQVAEDKGIFAKHGLDVDLTYFESYTDSLNALATGNIDGNSQTLNDTISSLSGGSRQSIVLTNDNSTGNDQIIVGPDIAEVEDLRGKKVAVEEGTVDHYLLLLGLQKAGMKPADIDLQALLTDAAAAAFASGQVDAVGAFAPFTDTALERQGSKVLFSSADFPGAIPDHLVMDRGFVEERPADVQKLVDAWFETLDFIARQPRRGGRHHGRAGGRVGRRLPDLRRRHHHLHRGRQRRGVHARHRPEAPRLRRPPDRHLPGRLRAHRRPRPTSPACSTPTFVQARAAAG